MNIRGQQIYAKKSGILGWEIRLKSYQKVRWAEIVEKTKTFAASATINIGRLKEKFWVRK